MTYMRLSNLLPYCLDSFLKDSQFKGLKNAFSYHFFYVKGLDDSLGYSPAALDPLGRCLIGETRRPGPPTNERPQMVPREWGRETYFSFCWY